MVVLFWCTSDQTPIGVTRVNAILSTARKYNSLRSIKKTAKRGNIRLQQEHARACVFAFPKPWSQKAGVRPGQKAFERTQCETYLWYVCINLPASSYMSHAFLI